MRFVSQTLMILALATVGAGRVAWADAPDHAKSPNDIVGDIRSQLGLGASDRIDPDKVPAPLLEQLGDAVMDTMVPNQTQHEWMDQMMGGEGSTGLAAAHRWMGYRYLTGGYGNGSYYGGMMGGGYGYGMMGGPGMMGGWGLMGNPSVPYGAAPYQSPEDIAKQRYAKGDITREQYMQLLDDLKKK
jgi:hypothetical protein